MKFNDLPVELKIKVVNFLDTTSLCFFAQTNKQHLNIAYPALIGHKALPRLNLVARNSRVFAYTSNKIYVCGHSMHGSGELGIGHINSNCKVFSLLPQLSDNIKQIALGDRHTLALVDRKVFVCGGNRYGESGLKEYSIFSRIVKTLAFIPMPSPPPGNVELVAAGFHNSFVLTNQGLYVCGFNGSGELGLGHNNDQCTNFVLVSQLPPNTVRQIIAGVGHTLVLTDQGLYGSGSNQFGQLGLGDMLFCLNFTALTRLPVTNNIQQVVTSNDYTLVLTSEGLYVSGANQLGQLGLGHTNPCRIFTLVPQFAPGSIKQIAAGFNHTLVLTNNGLFGCGHNRHGELGLGHNQLCSTFTAITQFAPDTIQQIVAGHHYTLILTNHGLYGSGDNSSGQLGLGMIRNVYLFAPIESMHEEFLRCQALDTLLTKLISLNNSIHDQQSLPSQSL